MTKVKICGLKNKEDILFAVNCGVDYIGLAFVPGHRHFINPPQVARIMSEIKDKVAVVGIFVDEKIEKIKQIHDLCRLDFIQLHGEELPPFCNQVKTFSKIIKAFKFGQEASVEQAKQQMNRYRVNYYIIDRQIQGEGEALDYLFAQKLACQFPTFLSGGLTANNVKEAILAVKPYGVDVSSGIETERITDRRKIKAFIQEAKYGN